MSRTQIRLNGCVQFSRATPKTTWVLRWSFLGKAPPAHTDVEESVAVLRSPVLTDATNQTQKTRFLFIVSSSAMLVQTGQIIITITMYSFHILSVLCLGQIKQNTKCAMVTCWTIIIPKRYKICILLKKCN